MSKITVHSLEASRAHRVLWLLEELGLTYEEVRYERNRSTMRAPDSLRKIHPLGKSPVVTVDDVVLAESGAILEYFVEREGRLGPADDEAHRLYRQWLHYAEGSLMPPLLVQLITGQLRTGPVPFFVKPLTGAVASKIDGAFTRPELERHAVYLDDHLAEHEWFAGSEFTAADVQMSYPVEALASRAKLGLPMVNIKRWIEQTRLRPGHQKALSAVGGQLFPGGAS